MRILNLYAGIGGNRAQWGDEHEVTAVEYDPAIAAAYAQLWPNDRLLVTDAHQYLIEHHDEFDFVWSSPPCQSHTRMQNLLVGGKGHAPKYVDPTLFQQIIFMQHWSPTPYVIENVIPYYSGTLPGAQEIGDRHLYWASFDIPPLPAVKVEENLRAIQIPELQKLRGINLDGIKLKNKRQVLRNCVSPAVGKHILDAFLGAPAPVMSGGLLDMLTDHGNRSRS